MNEEILSPDQQQLVAVKARVTERLAELRSRLPKHEFGSKLLSMMDDHMKEAVFAKSCISELEPLARMLGLE